MLTASAVAATLGIGRSTVYDLARRGELPSYRFGDALRFDPADVEVYRASCRSAGTRATSAGATNSTASLIVSGTALAAYFRKAGLEPKLTRTTEKRGRGSAQLQLVSSERTR